MISALEIQPEDRGRMIAEAAYYRYVRRGQVDGYAVEDWLLAEAEIEARCQAVEPHAHHGVGGGRLKAPGQTRPVNGLRILPHGLVEILDPGLADVVR